MLCFQREENFSTARGAVDYCSARTTFSARTTWAKRRQERKEEVIQKQICLPLPCLGEATERYLSLRRSTMWKTVDMKHRLRMAVMLLTSVSLLGPLAQLTPARADPRTALCTVQIAADGPVLGTLRTPSGLHLTVSVSEAGEVTVPLPCDSRDTAV